MALEDVASYLQIFVIFKHKLYVWSRVVAHGLPKLSLKYL